MQRCDLLLCLVQIADIITDIYEGQGDIVVTDINVWTFFILYITQVIRLPQDARLSIVFALCLQLGESFCTYD